MPKAHPLALKFLHLMLGDMKFSAIKLRPTSSVPSTSRHLQLHLWGLTLGISSHDQTNSRCPHRLPWYPYKVVRLTTDLLPPYSSRKLWTFPTYSMPDIAFFTLILTVSSRGKARESGKIAADATTGPDGYILHMKS